MKAVVLASAGTEDNLTIQDLPKPEPGAGQVLVRLQASALNRRDFWITRGQYPDIQLPCVLGADGAGIVEAVGQGVDDSCIGDEVVIYPAFDWGGDPRIQGPDFRILGMPDNGTFAEYISVPRDNIQPKPEHLDMTRAAALPLAGLTAWRALVTKAAVHPGETVLLTGIGGGVATMALMLAAAMGVKIIVTSSHERKLARAIELGAADGFIHTADDWHRDLRRKHGGVDVVIDGNCGPLFQPCFESMQPGGRYIIFGFTQGAPVGGLDPSKLFFRQLRIEGTTMSTAAEFRAMLEFVSDHRLEPLIDKSFALADAVAAHRYIGSGAQMGKVIFNHS